VQRPERDAATYPDKLSDVISHQMPRSSDPFAWA